MSLIFSFFLLIYRAKNKMSSRAGGRKRNDLQDYVFNDSDNGTATHQVWKCKGEGCNFKKKVAHGYSMPATRFVVHIVCHCKGFSMDVKKKVAKTSKTKQVVDWLAQQMETNSDNDDDYISTDNNNKRKGNNSNSFFNNNGSKKKMKQPTIDSSLDKCSPERAKMITRFLTKFIVSNAIPFTIVQSESFIEMIGA